MAEHVLLWQFDGDSKNLNDEHNSGELEGDIVRVSPCRGSEPVEAVWADNNAKDRGDGCLTDIELLLYGEGDEREDGGESTNTGIGDMCFTDLRRLVLCVERNKVVVHTHSWSQAMAEG